jgi:hypothetical protein
MNTRKKFTGVTKEWCAFVGRMAESRISAAQGINTNRNHEKYEFIDRFRQRDVVC